jgi:hypothetical protein
MYGLKGGSTEFWAYYPDADTWVELESLPKLPSLKPVKGGGALAYGDGCAWALKGNRTSEFWCYYPGDGFLGSPRPEAVHSTQASGGLALGDWRMAISPNPLASGFAVLRYGLPKAGSAQLSVYNVAGQAVMARTLVAGRSGIVNLDLRHFSNGVYLVKMTSEGCTNSQKLVVQR